MDIRKLALEQQDFFTRLKVLHSSRITPKTFLEMVSASNAFNKEKDETLDASFRRGVDAKKQFRDAWGSFVKANGGEYSMAEFGLLKTAFEVLENSSQDVYTQTIQVRVYGDELNLKLVEALDFAYTNPNTLIEDDRKEIMELAQQMSRINESVSRMAKRYAEKLRDGKVETG
jgi:hypothetical protein